MQIEKLTLEEFLILLDAADKQLSSEAARVIRELNAKNESLQFKLEIFQSNARAALSKLETLEKLIGSIK